MSLKRLGCKRRGDSELGGKMKFMLISYATKDWEAGLPPDPRLLAAIPRLYEKMPKGASLISTGGLAPSSMGAKVRVSRGKVAVTDGPFTETKEVLGGFAIVNAGSKEEAIAIAKGFWELHVEALGPSYEGGGEIRPMFHQEECEPRHQVVGETDATERAEIETLFQRLASAHADHDADAIVGAYT